MKNNSTKRPSGRALDEMRAVTLEPDFAKHAEGSCIAHFGDPLDVRMRDLSDGQGTAAQFDILPVAA